MDASKNIEFQFLQNKEDLYQNSPPNSLILTTSGEKIFTHIGVKRHLYKWFDNPNFNKVIDTDIILLGLYTENGSNNGKNEEKNKAKNPFVKDIYGNIMIKLLDDNVIKGIDIFDTPIFDDDDILQLKVNFSEN